MEAQNRMRRSVAVAALVLGLTVTAPASATHQSRAVGDFDAEASRVIEEIVRDYILNHPEVMIEAAQRLRAQRQRAEDERRREAASGVRPVNGEDHIIGSLDAPVKLIEFSDFECPFCKRFHRVMKRVMGESRKTGKVAWVDRHFPHDSLHSTARKEAHRAHGTTSGLQNEAFWSYTDTLFEVTPSNNRLDLAVLPRIAQDIGLDRAKFEACLAGDARGGKYAAHIEADVQDATASGGTGTPYSLVVAPNGKVFTINGAQPYRAVKSIIELALKQK